MRYAFIAGLALLGAVPTASAQVSLSISIGAYPSMMAIPGYPVYYAPGLDYNFFFYDGLYWIYQDDNWYSSTWYNGPWDSVGAFSVPIFMLQVPVRYYRRPPVFFRGWQGDDAPHWGDHWGRSWSQQRSGWDRRPEGNRPAPAPLPEYQRRYSGGSYPARDQQHMLQQANAPRTQPADRAQPARDRPTTDRPAAGRPTNDRPTTDRPGAVIATPERPTQEQRAAPAQRAAPELRSAPQAQRAAPEQRDEPQAQRPERAAPQQERRQGNPGRGNDPPRGEQRKDAREPRTS
jgi:hypothetical protein